MINTPVVASRSAAPRGGLDPPAPPQVRSCLWQASLWQDIAGGVLARDLGQKGGGPSFYWWWMGGGGCTPACCSVAAETLRPGRASMGSVCFCRHVRSATAMMVEDVPSRVAAVLLPLILLCPSFPRGLVSGTTVRHRGWLLDRGGVCWLVAVGWSTSSCLGLWWVRGSGEIPVGLFDADAVTPVGVIFLPEGRCGNPYPILSTYRGNP